MGNSIKMDSKTQNSLENLLRNYPLLSVISKAIIEAGGRVLLVGGAVRDLLLEKAVKDIDIEVYNIALEQLEILLSNWGPVDLVGKSFGVLRLHNLAVDWSIPRSDSAGRKPTVLFDPHFPIEKAFERRDLTINAMGIDLHTYELIDPFNGRADLASHRLRSPNINLFVQDPLRFFRVMHFIGRFEMEPDEELNNCCTYMVVTHVSSERIAGEFEKLLLLSRQPSRGIRWLAKIGRLADILPEVYQLCGVPQEQAWHPEGDVFEHSMQALDAAACVQQPTDYEMLVLRYAALCHDLGKALTTKCEGGVWRSIGHEIVGAKLSRTLLHRICQKLDLIDDVALLVRHHMAPVLFVKGEAGSAAYKRLAKSLMPRMNLQMLAQLACADHQGRNPLSHEPLKIVSDQVKIFMEKAEQAAVMHTAEKPILQGRDLLDLIPPGPALGVLLKKAYEIQIEEGITDKDELKRRVVFY